MKPSAVMTGDMALPLEAIHRASVVKALTVSYLPMKKCFRCAIEKPCTDFYRSKKSTDGYLGVCKVCKCACAQERYICRKAHGWHTETKTATELFWEKVKVLGPDDCWEWQAYKDKDGYGTVWDASHKGRRRTGGQRRAHRVSYEMCKGCIGEYLVLHSCDNPSCVNPAHLFLGTNDDNMKDMATKGRSPSRRGEESPNAKLTWQSAEEIRSKYATGQFLRRELEAEYKMSRSAIGRVISGKSWCAPVVRRIRRSRARL